MSSRDKHTKFQFLWSTISFAVLLASACAASAGDSHYWQSQSSGIIGAQSGTQPAAIASWIAASNNSWTWNGSCGAPGTSTYRACPVTRVWDGAPGNIDVPLVCPGNFVSPDGLTCPSYFVSADMHPKADCGHGCNMTGDPISPASGNSYYEEVDLSASSGQHPLRFVRFTNSANTGWFHNWNRAVVPRFKTSLFLPHNAANSRQSSIYLTRSSACQQGWAEVRSGVQGWETSTAQYSNSKCNISVNGIPVGSFPVDHASEEYPADGSALNGYDLIRADGQVIRMLGSTGTAIAPTGIAIKLVIGANGFTVTDTNDSVESYDSAGKLQSITYRGGEQHTLTYTTSGKVATVSDSVGNVILLSYDGVDRIQTLSYNGSIVVTYGYNPTGALGSITRADQTGRSYGYSGGRLASVWDEAGVALSTWTYDTFGRATATSEVLGSNAVTLAYNANGSVTTTDSFGAVRTFSFSRIGDKNLVAAISGSQCPTCRESAATMYDAAGYVSSRVDYVGNKTCYANDSTRGLETVRIEGFSPGASCPGNLSTYTPASGTRQRKISTTWHASYRVPTQVVESKRTTNYTYDASGNLLTKAVTDTGVSPNVTRTWTFTYNAYGRVLTEDGPRTDVADVTTYAYYSCVTGYQCGQLQSVTNAAGQVTTYNSYNAFGLPTQITDANGVVTALAYDLRQNPTARCVGGALPACAGGELTTLDYWATGLLKSMALPDGSYTAYSYDAAHRLTSVTDGLGNHVDFALDTMGNRTAESVYDPGNVLRRTHTRVFNTLNRLYQDVDAAATGGATTTYAYDNNGNQTTISAPLSRNSTKYYDELNRLKQITDPGSGNTYFAYDASDNLTSVTDPKGLVTSYAYTGFGDVKSLTSPDTGVTTNTYDSGGNLQNSTDARSAVSTYVYDALNRVTSVSYTIGSTTDQSISFGYDAGTYGKGQLTSASDANHSMSWVYDAQGRVSSKAQTQGAVTSTVGYGYANGLLTSLTLPSGNVVTYGYDANGLVTSVALGSTAILSGVTYAPFGPVKGWTWGNASTQSRSYDLDGRLTVINTSTASGVNLVFGYDSASRITGQTDSGSSPNSWTYGYNVLDRLSTAIGPTQTQGWTYDANGNRLTETGTQASTFTVSGTSNRLNSTSGFITRTYTYDAVGNALTYEDVTLAYNNRGRLSSTTKGSSTRSYVYNALGQQIRASGGASGATLYAYDESGHLLGEYTSTGALIQETIWLGDIPVATIRPGSPVQIYYVHADHLGTPVRVTRPSDDKNVWQWASDPFGTLAANENPESLGSFAYNLRFPGQLFDGQAGLHQNYFRDYSPATGRYVQSDPIGLGGGLNSYAYVSSSPIDTSDPTGEFGVVGAVIGGALDLGLQLMTNGGNLKCVDWGDVGLAMVGGALTGGLASGAGKLKSGSHAWSRTRQWLGQQGLAARGQHVHHWLVEQGSSFGRKWPQVFNQPWNLNPMRSPELHRAIHALPDGIKQIVGAPSWAQGAAAGGGLAGVNPGEGCGCN